MTQDEGGLPKFFDTCSFACEIDLSDLIQRGQGRIEIIQTEGSFRLRLEGRGRPIEMEMSNKPGETDTKVHKYKLK